MAAKTLTATSRTEFGKGAARRIRATNQIPAVIYSNGAEPLHVTLPGHQTMLVVRTVNALLEIDVQGENHLTLVKDVQRNPVTQLIEHIDLQGVRRGEKVTVDVLVHVVGEQADPNAYVNLDQNSISVEADATAIPESFEADITGREIGDHLYVSDLALPAGVSLVTDAETLLVNISEPTVQDLGEEPETEETAEGETAEGEAAEGESTEDESAE
ncbi:50S ribosomal protein L25/general stress protein Ctc [Tersicoccus sp. Bi-70]|uniref:50S ribosomal protein L25/general stress protein Ctc n=1 Tax=Tersicoccus sp. Bi-70 TaxID=1897634 RepID=UPI0009769F69|nr:50S ribosomal protein L25/general stress protein Ctc [Tersicoccus sp. Bi-70]OMH31382.1 50S ribosomal protein L25/general stress protein Ctc [Tersicoccus sp. Bi-70]